MKKLALILGWWLALAGWCPAQVPVEIVLEREQFLRSESLPIKVRVINSSGQALHLGREAEWLSFEIRNVEGGDVPRLEPVPLAGPFDLAQTKIANLSIDLMPYYDLSKIGRYAIAATLRVPQLNQTFVTKPKEFDIISGTKLWEREFGVPSAGAPEVRKYALQQANFVKQSKLYLRVTDPQEARIFRVLCLGTMVSFSKPETQFDKSSNLHILFQSAPRQFLYQVVGPDGELVIRQTYEYVAGSRPLLTHDEQQGVHVKGGKRRIVLSDVPAPPEETPPPPPPETLFTNAPPKSPTTPAK